MKYKNKIMVNGLPPHKTRGRDETKNDPPHIPVKALLAAGIQESPPIQVKPSDADDFRAQMHLRYTTPFPFVPWQHGGLNE
jgi:hypothetical protein